MSSYTPTSRGYAWAKQVDYLTPKAPAAAAYKQLILTDQNFLDQEAATQNDEDWSHGVNSATDEWLESHGARVQHTMPGFIQQFGELFYLNMGQYSVAAHSGGTLSKDHKFKPTDPNVTRQDPAVSYLEKAGAGWKVMSESMVGDGFTLKGDAMQVLTADFGLVGSGKIDFASAATWFPTATPTVARRTGLHKLFNSQVALVCTDGGGAAAYGCRYRSFEISYKKTLLDAAGYQPGCARFLSSGDPTSGAIRSSHEFDKQTLDFTFVVDMAAGSPEAVSVQQQKPTEIVLTATGGIIEDTIPYTMVVTIPIATYTAAKPTVADGIMRMTISGKGLFDFTTGEMFDIALTDNIATYANAF